MWWHQGRACEFGSRMSLSVLTCVTPSFRPGALLSVPAERCHGPHCQGRKLYLLCPHPKGASGVLSQSNAHSGSLAIPAPSPAPGWGVRASVRTGGSLPTRSPDPCGSLTSCSALRLRSEVYSHSGCLGRQAMVLFALQCHKLISAQQPFAKIRPWREHQAAGGPTTKASAQPPQSFGNQCRADKRTPTTTSVQGRPFGSHTLSMQLLSFWFQNDCCISWQFTQEAGRIRRVHQRFTFISTRNGGNQSWAFVSSLGESGEGETYCK